MREIKPADLQLCSTCQFRGRLALVPFCEITPKERARQAFEDFEPVTTPLGCSFHVREDTPPIGEGLVGWLDTSRYLTASEIVALGSFLIGEKFEACPVCRENLATDAAHAVRKKSGGRLSGRDGLQVALCRRCHRILDDSRELVIAVEFERAKWQRSGFRVHLLGENDSKVLLGDVKSAIVLDGRKWKERRA